MQAESGNTLGTFDRFLHYFEIRHLLLSLITSTCKRLLVTIKFRSTVVLKHNPDIRQLARETLTRLRLDKTGRTLWLAEAQARGTRATSGSSRLPYTRPLNDLVLGTLQCGEVGR